MVALQVLGVKSLERAFTDSHRKGAKLRKNYEKLQQMSWNTPTKLFDDYDDDKSTHEECNNDHYYFEGGDLIALKIFL